MVRHYTTLGRNGVHDYILLRVSALIIASYVCYLVAFISLNSLSYELWLGFFSKTSSKVFTILTLLSVLVHAWIGLWQVLTDYIKVVWLRGLLQCFVIVVLLVYLLVGVTIVWGI